jgi:cytochrome c-type biogenesis protein CcmH
VKRAALIAALLAGLLFALPASALAGADRGGGGEDRGGLDPAPTQAGATNTQANATLPDIEDEVMCTICGTALQLANSPQAERERAFINRLIAQGKTKDEIKDALVAEYGPDVLAVPEAKGFDLTAFVVPVVGVLAALLLIGLAARRWRRASATGDGDAITPDAPPLDPEDDERLQADLRRYGA